jgi:hypothetical protein
MIKINVKIKHDKHLRRTEYKTLTEFLEHLQIFLKAYSSFARFSSRLAEITCIIN